jgi:hypothetical protein
MWMRECLVLFLGSYRGQLTLIITSRSTLVGKCKREEKRLVEEVPNNIAQEDLGEDRARERPRGESKDSIFPFSLYFNKKYTSKAYHFLSIEGLNW